MLSKLVNNDTKYGLNVMCKPILTIGIPTYNRPDDIQKTVRSLLPQLNGKVKLVIHDNCSDTPVKDLFTDEEKVKFSIIRNKVNIGGDANIAGVIYYAETKWVWTLGDDDLPVPNAVDIILEQIERHPNELYLKFGSTIEKETNSLEELVELCKIRHFYPNLLFISVTVFNREMLNSDLVHYYTNISFMNGQVVFLLKHLEREPGKCLFLNKGIIENHGMGDGWDYETMIKRTIQIRYLFPSQKKLFNKTLYAGMAFMYYRAIFFSERISSKSRYNLFFYVIKRIGFYNTFRYNYSIVVEFLISLLLPKSFFEKVKKELRKKYYNRLRDDRRNKDV